MTLNPLIVIFYALCSHLLGEVASLPVTSKPLASNPDHLAWEAWLTVDSRNPLYNDMTRKITPKSIFIAPNFRNESLPCPTGFKVDHRGQCIRVVSIDPNDLLANRLQSILASTNIQMDDDEIYDYDSYDTSGPFQVNLPISLDADSKLEQSQGAKETPEGLRENTQILNGEPSSIQETVEDGQETTTSSDEEMKFTTDMSLASSEDATEDITETVTTENFTSMPNSEISSEMPANSTGSSLEGLESSTTEIAVEEERATQSTTEVFTEQSTDESSTTPTVTENGREILAQEKDEMRNSIRNSTLKIDLERDDLVLDVSSMTQSTDLEETTTDEVTESIATSSSPQTSTSSSTSFTVESNRRPIEEKRVVIITDKFKPSRKESVLIVTPIPNILISTTETVDDTTQFDGEKELLGVLDESDSEKKMREMVIHQEQKDAAMEKIDANNRFVYHHLKNPVTGERRTEAPQEVTHSRIETIVVTTAEPVEKVTTASPVQVKTTEKLRNRIRFPTNEEEEDPPDEFKGDLIRFPGPASHRFLPNINRLIPESVTRRPPTPTTQTDSNPGRGTGAANRKQSSWYPPTWGRNSTKQQKPVLLRFWSRMPLIRDSSFTGRRSLGHRENSKSPSENLYKDIPSQDIYRVIGSRQKKHTNS